MLSYSAPSQPGNSSQKILTQIEGLFREHISFAEASTPTDYALAAVAVVPVAGDFVKHAAKQGDLAAEIGSIIYTAARKVGSLNGGPLENAVQVRGRFKIENGPANSTVYRADDQGNITSYATYDAEGKILTRVDVTGAAHNGIPTPHVLEYGRDVLPNGSVRVQTPRTNPRPAKQDEIP
ncbi:polymorphic toxin type 24 domain-containing protein [Polycladidibacter stylochi]|uniref:polymorphic toxin type 24 domain-containing protein n=1 Tax=Polycladidibacter stylochi TaxID=1807766 RepID=UPI0009E6C750|nr:polymorphic toxin type 24 domain-containing protein [Pseudovibrio stylochi]